MITYVNINIQKTKITNVIGSSGIFSVYIAFVRN